MSKPIEPLAELLAVARNVIDDRSELRWHHGRMALVVPDASWPPDMFGQATLDAALARTKERQVVTMSEWRRASRQRLTRVLVPEGSSDC